AGGPRELVAALLLGDDLLQRASVLSGQIDRAEPAVLTDSQLAGDQPLPEFLAPAEQDPDSPPPSDDAVWESYFRDAAQVACRAGSRFLAAWVAWDSFRRRRYPPPAKGDVPKCPARRGFPFTILI
ncbi:hypothetical protein LCGC14_2685530, partial [marine sediment metagenome]